MNKIKISILKPKSEYNYLENPSVWLDVFFLGSFLKANRIDVVMDESSADVNIRKITPFNFKEFLEKSKPPNLILFGDIVNFSPELLDNIDAIKMKNIFKDIAEQFKIGAFDVNEHYPMKHLKEEYLQFIKDDEFAIVSTSLGCCYNCGFCSVQNREHMVRSPESIEQEIHQIKEHKQKIHFLDDAFMYDKKRFLDICRRLETMQGMIFNCYGSINVLDLEMIHAMKRANFKIITCGFETIHPKSMNEINRAFNVPEAEIKIRKLQENGIKVVGSFLIGIPGENAKDIEKTFNWAKKHLDNYHFTPFTPVPGSVVYEKQKRDKRWMLSNDRLFYYTSKDMEKEELVESYIKFNKVE